ncbi:hypothetical protein QJS10_CPB12g01588 [Acorus calamus]|uniref:Uncharacterized protein n=1 Tax=Acorus calamus TaxID=4465 RepID=A0AAV9DL97_ACOCL|nr:hypothetical protein QJS10_CPB12g01588 [Acorus calamus]
MLQPISSRSIHSSDDTSTSLRLVDKQQRRTSPIEEHDRLNKRRKGDSETKDGEGLEVRLSDRDRSGDRQTDKALPMEPEKTGDDDRVLVKPTDKLLERANVKGGDRYERDHRERFDRSDKSRAEEIFSEKSRDRSMERHARERSSERVQERGTERSFDRLADKNKDERSKPRHSEISNDKSHLDDRFHGQSLPPPPPLPPNIVPQSVGVSRRDEEADRRAGSSTRHMQRLSPRHDEKERRRSEENVLSSQDDAKRRREEDLRERKRDERDGGTMKVEDRDREKGTIVKDDMDPAAATKRRKIKRDHLSSEASGEYPPVAPPPSLSMGTSSQSFDGRERGDRKGVSTQQRAAYMEETVPRSHSKEATSKVTRRDNETMYERDWEEEKRLRAEPKRKHRK